MKQLSLILGVLAIIAVAGVSSAEDAVKPDGPCKADMEKFCASVEKGHGGKHKCLREHKDEASAECKAHMDLKKQQFTAMKTACEPDRNTLCKDKKGKDLHQCMKDNDAQVSQACKDAKVALRPKQQ